MLSQQPHEGSFRTLEEEFGQPDVRAHARASYDRKRMEAMQAEQEEEAMRQQFTQRLYQRLNARIGTTEDTNPDAAKAAFIARMMMQMQRGYGT